jgi:uncharacterized protein (DUF2461 family)
MVSDLCVRELVETTLDSRVYRSANQVVDARYLVQVQWLGHFAGLGVQAIWLPSQRTLIAVEQHLEYLADSFRGLPFLNLFPID